MRLWSIEARHDAENAAVTSECMRCMVSVHQQLFNTDWTDTAFDAVHSDSPNQLGLKEDDVSSALLMAYLVPYYGWQVPVKKKLQSLHWYLIRDALKLPAKESELCDQIFSAAASLTHLAHSWYDMHQLPAADPALPTKQLDLIVHTGKLLRSLGLSHPLALLLAPVLESSSYPNRPPAVSAFFQYLHSSTPLFSHTVWTMRPLLDGDEVQSVLGLRPGRHISTLQDRLIGWQIERLEAVQERRLGAADVTAFLVGCRDALLREGVITDKHLSKSDAAGETKSRVR